MFGVYPPGSKRLVASIFQVFRIKNGFDHQSLSDFETVVFQHVEFSNGMLGKPDSSTFSQEPALLIPNDNEQHIRLSAQRHILKMIDR
jgi:hypothetical protein